MRCQFATEKVMSVVTGVLVCEMGGVYEVLNWMTGEDIFTHQIPRVSREAVPVLLAAHPEFQQAIDEADQVNSQNYQEWLATWKARYGDNIEVPQMTIAEHERIDPMSEAAEHFHPDRIIPVAIQPDVVKPKK